MSRRGRNKSSYVPDPDRRAYLRVIRTIRNQVYAENEDEFSSAGFFKRITLRLRMEREIRRRSQGIREGRRNP